MAQVGWSYPTAQDLRQTTAGTGMSRRPHGAGGWSSRSRRGDGMDSWQPAAAAPQPRHDRRPKAVLPQPRTVALRPTAPSRPEHSSPLRASCTDPVAVCASAWRYSKRRARPDARQSVRTAREPIGFTAVASSLPRAFTSRIEQRFVFRTISLPLRAQAHRTRLTCGDLDVHVDGPIARATAS